MICCTGGAVYIALNRIQLLCFHRFNRAHRFGNKHLGCCFGDIDNTFGARQKHLLAVVLVQLQCNASRAPVKSSHALVLALVINSATSRTVSPSLRRIGCQLLN
jgi:hypothetical protein